MLDAWLTYFPFATGMSFAIDGGVIVRGAGEVELRTDDVLRMHIKLPSQVLHPEIEVTLELRFRQEGRGNRLVLRRPGRPDMEDDDATIRSYAAALRRSIVTSVAVDGRPLTLDMRRIDDSAALLVLNGQSLTCSRAPVDARLAQAPAATRADGGAQTLSDWARFVSFTPKMYARPSSMEELKALIEAVAQRHLPAKTVRAVGSLHSCSDIIVSEAIIDVSGLPKELEFNADKTAVTASANWTLHEFLLRLHKEGKSLPATGGTDEQTLAGLISTNTAPATSKQSMYETLRGVEFMTLDAVSNQAVVRRVNREDPDFNAVVCSLGAIGVITKVHFGLVDEPFFETIQKVVPMQSILSNLKATSERYDFWRVNWLPESDKALLWAARRIPASQADPDGDYEPDKAENILLFVFKLIDRFSSGSAGPLLDGTMKAVYDLLATVYNLDEPVAKGPLRNMLPVDRRAPLRVAMAEWSFDPADLPCVLETCRIYFDTNGWPNIPTEIELTKCDQYFMSPWNWQGIDFVVKFNFMYLTDVGDPDTKKDSIRAHLLGLWDALVAAGIQFKAHWGKLNFMDPTFVAARFDLARFKPLTRKAFVNEYVAERIENRGTEERPRGKGTRYGVVDLHSHFPMHIDASVSGTALGALRRLRRHRVRDSIRAAILNVACRLDDYPDDVHPGVTLPKLMVGHVGVALSVLYQPFDEMDIEHGFQSAPRASYFSDLLDEMDRVEKYVGQVGDGKATFVRSPRELQLSLDNGQLALIHAVEGGFHLGNNDVAIERNVRELANRGVGYVTVAHLFWRGIATNAPALPFMSDRTYRTLFPQPNVGLSALGRTVVQSMARHKIVVDVTHMSEQAVADTLDTLPADVPIFATHIACRSKLTYNLTDETIRRIAARGGVMGTILCEHYSNEGHPRTRTFADSVAALIRQIDHIRSVTRSDDHVAIGSDLDGFIKPALAGMGDASALAQLEAALVDHYGAALAEKICSGNALRILLGYWRGGIADGTLTDLEPQIA